jgi:hypothetical protein
VRQPWCDAALDPVLKDHGGKQQKARAAEGQNRIFEAIAYRQLLSQQQTRAHSFKEAHLAVEILYFQTDVPQILNQGCSACRDSQDMENSRYMFR